MVAIYFATNVIYLQVRLFNMSKIEQGDYARVPIEEFVSGSTVNVDVFIQLSDSKYVKVVKAGDSLNIERLSSYTQKHVSCLFVRKVDYAKYIDRGLSIAGIIINNHDLPQRIRTSSITDRKSTR